MFTSAWGNDPIWRLRIFFKWMLFHRPTRKLMLSPSDTPSICMDSDYEHRTILLGGSSQTCKWLITMVSKSQDLGLWDPFYSWLKYMGEKSPNYLQVLGWSSMYYHWKVPRLGRSSSAEFRKPCDWRLEISHGPGQCVTFFVPPNVGKRSPTSSTFEEPVTFSLTIPKKGHQQNCHEVIIFFFRCDDEWGWRCSPCV